METVQIRCGSCQQVMAISVEHLGGQVHCPHCQAIVQTPPKPEARHSEARKAEGRPPEGEAESIFTGPEASEDLFSSGPPRSLVEMPEEKTISGEGFREPESSLTEPFGSPASAKMPDFNLDKGQKDSSALPWTDAPTLAQDSLPIHAGATDQANLALPPRRVVQKRSLLGPVLLIFLIPYAIMATVVIAYLLYNQKQVFDPLERLPDPKPKDGGPRLQVSHDAPLPHKLKTRLAQAIRIGDLEVTPVKVELKEDALVLNLRMKNVSRDVIFNPISDEFLKFAGGSMTANRPYTFLDWNGKRFYGGFPEWLAGPPGKEEMFNGEIGPGQEELIRIVTMPRYKDDARKLADSRDTVIWRVQVRRGLVDVRGNKVSATAVIGVEFNAQAIEKEV